MYSIPALTIPQPSSRHHWHAAVCNAGRRVWLALALAMTVAPAWAGWTANATVTKLVVTGDGGVNVRLSPDLAGCQSNAGYGPNFASIYPSHPGINRIKADLLAAYLTGGTVSLYLSDAKCTVVEVILGGW